MSNIETAEDEFGASAKKNQPVSPLDIAVAKLKPGPALDFAVAALQELKTQAAEIAELRVMVTAASSELEQVKRNGVSVGADTSSKPATWCDLDPSAVSAEERELIAQGKLRPKVAVPL
jgi:hypothetical protein